MKVQESELFWPVLGNISSSFRHQTPPVGGAIDCLIFKVKNRAHPAYSRLGESEMLAREGD
jgi:hypothetical protein